MRRCDVRSTLGEVVVEGLGGRTERIENTLEEIGGPRHKRITKTSKVCPVAHFFGEDVRRIAFSADMGYGDGAIFDPFARRIFSVFDVAIALCSQVVAPFDTGVVVVVKLGRRIGIIDGVPE